MLAYSEGCANCPDAGHKHIGVALGAFGTPRPGESATFADLTPLQPVFPWATEDPSIFRDPDSGFWHILAHRTSSTAGGGPAGDAVASHAVAPSPYGPWKLATVPPYGRDITWDDGSKSHAQKRERPQIIVAENGTMVALSNGVRPGRAATPITPQGFTGDWTYTHVQLIDRRPPALLGHNAAAADGGPPPVRPTLAKAESDDGASLVWSDAVLIDPARPAPFASRSLPCALLTPQVNPGLRYRCSKSTFKGAACGLRQEERGLMFVQLCTPAVDLQASCAR